MSPCTSTAAPQHLPTSWQKVFNTAHVCLLFAVWWRTYCNVLAEVWTIIETAKTEGQLQWESSVTRAGAPPHHGRSNRANEGKWGSMSDIPLNSLCCLPPAFAHGQQKIAGDFADVQGSSQTIWEERKANVASPGFGWAVTLNVQKGRKKHQCLVWLKHTHLRDLASKAWLQNAWDWAVPMWGAARGAALGRSGEPVSAALLPRGCSNAEPVSGDRAYFITRYPKGCTVDSTDTLRHFLDIKSAQTTTQVPKPCGQISQSNCTHQTCHWELSSEGYNQHIHYPETMREKSSVL